MGLGLWLVSRGSLTPFPYDTFIIENQPCLIYDASRRPSSWRQVSMIQSESTKAIIFKIQTLCRGSNIQQVNVEWLQGEPSLIKNYLMQRGSVWLE